MAQQAKPTSAPVLRGRVSQSFKPVRVLAGFMDGGHFGGFAQEHLLSLTKAKQAALLKLTDDARVKVSALAPMTGFATEIRPIDPASCDHLSRDKTFISAFGNTSHRFVWIRPENLVSIQAFVNAQNEVVPTKETELIEFALPRKWSVPAEISFIPPTGPIYVVSSSPHLAGLSIRMDTKKGQIIMEPPLHVNLVQVMQFNGRYYLRNGYHRVVGALSAGISELPALVIDGNQPADVELPNLGLAGFNVGYLMGLPRPPLVSDFNGDCAIEILMREKRYGASVSLQISPLNIGV